MATPPLSFFVREPDGLSLLSGPPLAGDPTSKLSKIVCASARFSDDGSKLAITSESAVNIYDTTSGSEIRSFKLAGVKAAIFSPRGTFLQTFEPPNQQQKNLSLWNVTTGASVFQQYQKTFSRSSWPVIQFSKDETVACRLVTNEVHFFDPAEFSKGIVDRLRLPGIEGVQLATAPPTHVAAYVPEAKGSPASVRIFERVYVSQAQAVARRSFFKSSTAQLLWNRGSTALLVLAQSDVDKTNQSYYGETRLHFLTSNGSHEGSIPLSKEGPVHDVQWSPSGTEFLVVYGFMPACATLFDARGKSLFNFGSGPYNTVRWNPHGRFLCVAGFGNLPGDISFWDRTNLKCLGNTRAECSVTSEWSPDGRYLLTATTAPRLQVDNGIKIFKYDGSLCFEKKYDKLYQAEWKPASGIYQDRPASPQVEKGREVNLDKSKKNDKGFGSAAGKPATGASKPTAYQAPHARAASAIKAQLLGEDTLGSTGDMSKSALKNKKRRDKQKEKKDVLNPPVSNEDVIPTLEKQLDALPAGLNGGVESSGNDAGKKLRALQKKLRQIEELKQKVKEGSGSYSLTRAQQEKLSQEASLQEEIRILEVQGEISS